MSKFFKWALAVQIVGWAFLPAAAQLQECPQRPSPGSIVQDGLNLSSSNGALTLALALHNGVDAAGFTHYCFDYKAANGSTVEAPTLRLNPGDTLNIAFTDGLNVATPTDLSLRYSAAKIMKHGDMPGMSSNEPANPCKSTTVDFNTTNIHFHGLNVPPICHQDDVINTLIQAGQTFQYQVQIPTNEPPGLYWYHPHPHGFTALQVNGGAAGPIVINGMEKVKPQVQGLPERIFMIRQQFLNPLAWIPGPYQLTLNFQPATAPARPSPVIQMQPNEKQFWRVANATTQGFVTLQLLFGSTAQNMELIALDGVPVTGDPTVTSIALPPAGRAEFIVTGPPSGTTAQLVNAGFDTGPVGNANTFQILADVQTTSSSAARQPAVAAAPAPSLPAETPRFAGLASIKANTQRYLYFSEAALGTNPPVNFFLTVNGKQPKLFTMNEPPAIVTKVGQVEDWTIENRTSEEHAFHMHQIHFLVTAINGVPLTTPTMQDTFPVPYWSGSGPFPSITVRMDFRDPGIAGTFVFHCHILDHEDAGMMEKIQVNP